jgi:hypothetical protein
MVQHIEKHVFVVRTYNRDIIVLKLYIRAVHNLHGVKVNGISLLSLSANRMAGSPQTVVRQKIVAHYESVKPFGAVCFPTPFSIAVWAFALTRDV